MKNYKISIVVILLLLTAFLSSCEHHVQMKTKVHADGSLDKTIILESDDSTLTLRNYFNVGSNRGWQSSTKGINEKSKKFRYTFQKSFSSASKANSELAIPSDSAFRVTSKFESRFRWFYTHLYYSDTYQAINKFDLPVNDYLIKEDFQFIEKLPAEGRSISKADSLFLTALNERIFDHYATRGYFEDYFKLLLDFTSDASQKQLLKTHKETLFQLLSKMDNVDDNVLRKLTDSLGVSVDFGSAYKKSKALVENKIKFMTWAMEGKYNHIIEMPGEVVSHNADSVGGDKFYWTPSRLKFAFHDYTFFVETRKPNIWAWVISAVVLILASLGFIKRKQTVRN